MSCDNPYKHILRNSVHSFLDTFKVSESNSKNLSDEQMECMQFGICSFVPKTSNEITYFHF